MCVPVCNEYTHIHVNFKSGSGEFPWEQGVNGEETEKLVNEQVKLLNEQVKLLNEQVKLVNERVKVLNEFVKIPNEQVKLLNELVKLLSCGWQNHPSLQADK